MNNQTPQSPLFDEANAAREKAVYLYFRAFEHGDNEAMARILKQAETDGLLEAMIWQGHQLENAASAEVEQSEAATTLVSALEEAFPGKVLSAPQAVFAEMPPLTVADVAARLQTDESAQGQSISAPADRSALQQLSQMQEQYLPAHLTPRHLKAFFTQLGLQTTQRFQEQFKEAAVFLRMGRQQRTYLAATRSVRSGKKEKKEIETEGTASTSTETSTEETQ